MTHCWWCCHPYETETVQYPYKLFKGNILTTGQFCSWNCVKAYAINKNNLNSMDLITLLKKKTNGKVTPTEPAPCRESLIQFGGTLTIEEFRQAADLGIKALIPGVMYSPVHIEKTTEKPTMNIIKPEFVLKREKPLVRAKGKLETTLGITRKKC